MIKLGIDKDNIVFNIYENYLSDIHKTAYLLQKNKNKFDTNKFQSITYSELIENIYYYSKKINSLELQEKKIIILHPLNPKVISLIFSMFHTGVIPVFIDPNVGVKHLITCIKNSKAEIILTKPLLKPLVKLIRKRTGINKVITLKTLRAYNCTEKVTINAAKNVKNKTAGIFYTSGSTGVPKGVIWTHQNIHAQIQSLASIIEPKVDSINLALFPLFLIYGPIMGHTTIWPKVNISKPIKIPSKIIAKIVQTCKVDYTFGSPIIWRNLIEYCKANSLKIKGIERVLCGGAPIKETTIYKMNQLLSNGSFYVTYGATEALPISYYKTYNEDHYSEYTGTFLGNTLKYTSVKIDPVSKIITHIPYCNFQIGEILIKGEQVTPGYINHSKTTQNNDHWYHTGDYGYIDNNGGLWYYGRMRHTLKHKDTSYHPVPIEKQIRKYIDDKFCTITVFDKKIYLILERDYFRTLKMNKNEFIEKLNTKISCFGYNLSGLLIYPKNFSFDKRHYSKLDRIKIQNWAISQNNMVS